MELLFFFIFVSVCFALYLSLKNFPQRNLQEKTLIKTIPIKDFNYYEIYELKGIHFPEIKGYILRTCKEKDIIEVIPEPENPVNPEALGVYHDNCRIGYIADDDLNEVHKVIKQKHLVAIDSIVLDGLYLEVHLIIVFMEEI